MVAPNIPSSGTYLVPGISICSLIPKEKLPYSSKLDSLTLLLTASRARLKNSPASFPLSVTTAAIGSPFLTPKSLMAFFAFFVAGVLAVSWLRTFFAFSKGSPDLPVAMFRVTFSILTTRKGLLTSSSPLGLDILLFSYPYEGCSHTNRYHVGCGGLECLVGRLDPNSLPTRVGTWCY